MHPFSWLRRCGAVPVVMLAALVAGLVPGVLGAATALAQTGGDGAAETAPEAGEADTSFEPLPAEVELTRAVRRDLEQIQEQWRMWEQAFFRNEPERGLALIEGLELLVEQLGFERLPDLSVAAAQKALGQARQGGDAAWAGWALVHAERLDPGRPEVAFLRSQVHRAGGDWGAALASELEGYRRLWTLHPSRELAGIGLLVWLLQVAMLTAAGLVVVALLAHGGRLAADLEALLARTPLGRLPGWLQGLLLVALLVGPAVLPGGLLWVFLLLSALVFAYASSSLRVALAAGWIVLALAPTVAVHQEEKVELALSPPLRGLAGMAEGRLYGRLFQDLGRLGSALPQDPAVIQLMADLHRHLGQWETAQQLYRQVVEQEPDNAWALMDLGSYYFFNEDYGIARSYFEQATQLEGEDRLEERVAAFYNLSQAFSQLYLFPKAGEMLQQAQALDERMVSRLQRETGQDRIVTFDGGTARGDEIRARLASLGEESSRPRPLLRPLVTVLVVLALALGFRRLCRKLPGGRQPPRSHGRWTRVLIPGLGSAAAGRGGRALLAILPVVLLATLPLADDLALPFYPTAGDPGGALVVLAVIGLVTMFFVRALTVPAAGEVA